MDWIINAVPWWAWLVIAVPAALLALKYLGFSATIGLLGAGAAAVIYARGKAAGRSVEKERQHRADDAAREIIHEKKEDVRSIPSTPAGQAERNERFDRWSK
jgi:hypothetical protein